MTEYFKRLAETNSAGFSMTLSGKPEIHADSDSCKVFSDIQESRFE